MTRKETFLRIGSVAVILGFLSGCAYISSSGPSETKVENIRKDKPSIMVVDVNDVVTHRVLEAQKHTKFSEIFSSSAEPEFLVGSGDSLVVTLWEAPPATLFSVSNMHSDMATTPSTTFPEQMVTANGTIAIPFAGSIAAAGKTPEQIKSAIVKRLSGLANRPQVLVQVKHNATSNVTLIGEVKQSMQLPLTAKREKLLDALAGAGGVIQPVDKMTIQISRGGKIMSMSMEDVISDPAQNVTLQAGDVITAIHQPFSFTVLGASGKNEEVNFESKGITLAQALGRIGGLNDDRANPAGIFIFRFEDPAAVDVSTDNSALAGEKIPVIYRIDLSDPQTFLLAQNFPMDNKDVIYVANSASSELQKFLNILYGSIFSAVNVKAL